MLTSQNAQKRDAKHIILREMKHFLRNLHDYNSTDHLKFRQPKLSKHVSSLSVRDSRYYQRVKHICVGIRFRHFDNQKTYTINAPLPRNAKIVRATIMVFTNPPVAVLNKLSSSIYAAASLTSTLRESSRAG